MQKRVAQARLPCLPGFPELLNCAVDHCAGWAKERPYLQSGERPELRARNGVRMRLKPALHIRPQSILFTTDFSRASENALRHSIALARHYGATLHMAHVVSSVGFVLAGPGAMAAADQAAL